METAVGIMLIFLTSTLPIHAQEGCVCQKQILYIGINQHKNTTILNTALCTISSLLEPFSLTTGARCLSWKCVRVRPVLVLQETTRGRHPRKEEALSLLPPKSVHPSLVIPWSLLIDRCGFVLFTHWLPAARCIAWGWQAPRASSLLC